MKTVTVLIMFTVGFAAYVGFLAGHTEALRTLPCVCIEVIE